MKKGKLPFLCGFCLTIASSVLLSANLATKSPVDANKTNEEAKFESLSKLTKTISTVESQYVDKLTFSQIVDKAIAGLMGNLDAHSSYMNKEAFKDIKIQTSGQFGGIGITVGMKDGALTIIAPLEGTPADKAGLKPNDIILRIEGNSTIGLTADEAVSKMRGKEKTPLNLTIYRQGETKPFDVKILRDIIKVNSVYSKDIKDENILYLRVTSFDQNVVPDVKKAIQNSKNNKGIILDLRNNPGGLLDQAVGLVNVFVDKGVIVSQKGRDTNENIEYKAKKENKITSLPLAVLINGGSASASEIVSGSLQDLKRAILIGEKTFGKGSVQAIIPVSSLQDEALRLTIARYYLPSGRTIQAVGVKPDLIVYPGKVPESKDDGFLLKESDLKMHLENELEKLKTPNADKNITIKDIDKNSTKKQDDKIITQIQINNDIQLKTAIDAIKILNIK